MVARGLKVNNIGIKLLKIVLNIVAATAGGQLLDQKRFWKMYFALPDVKLIVFKTAGVMPEITQSHNIEIKDIHISAGPSVPTKDYMGKYWNVKIIERKSSRSVLRFRITFHLGGLKFQVL